MTARRHADIDVSYDEHALATTGPEREAAGLKAVLVAMQRGLASMARCAPRRHCCG
ncbi:hypothetical protein I553_6397 [Mycobacterium xenopi 4042]|uniref:Uncharacterized protein n=1 Tax=Mycobacterium xenopi 4042 TaxID=1299334 RepID=X8BEH8_MYCXE|nr:hypothetical protein I553_6397 [Mycobacterium xenopi 4042]